MSDDSDIDLATRLFAAWSSGDPDAPADLFAPDGVLFDTVGGTHHGWEEVRKFFADGVAAWSDLELVPERFWTTDDGVALTWTMSATVPDDRFGAEAQGKKWKAPGMTELVIRDEPDGRRMVVYEADHWNGGAIARSLKDTKWDKP